MSGAEEVLPEDIGCPGGILTDGNISQAVDKGYLIKKEVFEDSCVRHCSYALRVGRYEVLSPEVDRVDGYYKPTDRPAGCVTLRPRETTKVWSHERVVVPRNVTCRVDIVHQISAAGIMAGSPFADPGFSGHVFVTLHNTTDRVLTITEGSPLMRIDFTKLGQPVDEAHPGELHLGTPFVVATPAPDGTLAERLKLAERRLERRADVHVLALVGLWVCAAAGAAGLAWGSLPDGVQDAVSKGLVTAAAAAFALVIAIIKTGVVKTVKEATARLLTRGSSTGMPEDKPRLPSG
jgi:deoxycytidine triphosphate deaminase